MASIKGDKSLLNPKVMDGPSIRYTMNDIFIASPTMFLSYHCITTGSILFNNMGFLLGSGLYYTGLLRTAIPQRLLSSIVGTTTASSVSSSYGIASSTFGLLFGSLGGVLGAGALIMTATKGESATPIPFTRDGIQQRVDGLSHNYMVRTLDLSSWMGIVTTATMVLLMKRKGSSSNLPKILQFSDGALGIMQTISFGSAVGSMCGLGYFFMTK